MSKNKSKNKNKSKTHPQTHSPTKSHHVNNPSANNPISSGLESLDQSPGITKARLWAGAAFVWLLGFVIFWLTLYPSVPGGDSGELIAGACTLGVLHPPGYPLYTMITHLFTYLPHGTPAWRVNLFSAICTSSAMALLFATLALWTKRLASAFFGAFLFGFSPLIWKFAVQAEVFSFNNFFVCLLVFLATLWYLEPRLEPRVKVYLVTALVFGLSMSNHHTSLFVGVPILVWMTFHHFFRDKKPASVLFAVALSFVGLIPYFYIAIASKRIPLQSWGADLSSFAGVWGHFIRADYGTFKLAQGNVVATSSQFWDATNFWFHVAVKDSLYIGLVLALFGLYKELRKVTGLILTLTFCFVSYMIIFHLLSNLRLNEPLFVGVQERFWQQTQIFVFLCAGFGFFHLFEYLQGYWRFPRIRLGYVAGGVVAIAVTVQISINYRPMDQSQTRGIAEFGSSVLKPLPPNTLLLSLGDIYYNSMHYLQLCEYLRPDVKIVERAILTRPWALPLYKTNYPGVEFPNQFYTMLRRETLPPGHYNLVQLIQANAGKFPIAFVNPGRDEDLAWEQYFASYPYGYVSILLPQNMPLDISLYVKQSHAIAQGILDWIPKYRTMPPETWEKHVTDLFYGEEIHRSLTLFYYVQKFGVDPTIRSEIIQELETILRRHPGPPQILADNIQTLKRMGAK